MNQGYSVLDPIDPPERLHGAVLAALARARRRSARLELALQSLVCFFSGVLLVPLASYIGSELYASGFYEYLSLFFSDRTVALASWHEFAFSLVESLPSVALLLSIAAGTLLVWSLRRALRSSKAAFTPLASV